MSSFKTHCHAVIWSLFLLLALPCASGAGTEKLLVRPDLVQVTTLFSGAYIEVSSNIPAGSQAVVEIIGKKIEEELMRKSRHWDLWLNSGEVDIDNVPVLYFALKQRPTSSDRRRARPSLGIRLLGKTG